MSTPFMRPIAQAFRRARWFACALMFSLTACSGDLPKGWEIRDFRVLGARLEVAGDTSRSQPTLDESVVFRWLLESPHTPVPVEWAFAACKDASVSSTLPACAADPFFSTTGAEAPPSFELPLSGSGLAEGDRIRIIGSVCANGKLSVGEVNAENLGALTRCEGVAAEKRDVTLSLSPATTADAANLNPSFTKHRLTFAGNPWDAYTDIPPDAGSACAALPTSAALPKVAVPAKGDPHDITIGFVVDQSDRERVDGELEAFQFSHFINAGGEPNDPGELARQFTVVEGEPDASDTPPTLDWTPPKRDLVPTDGRLVRVTFVLRDSRGGFDSTERYACLVQG